MTILSDPRTTLPFMQVNPWQRLAEDWPHLQVVYRDLGSQYRHGETRWKRGEPQAVVLHQDLTQVQRRCALAHELEHLDRGAPCESLKAKVEARVVRATARYLLPDLTVVSAALECYDMHRAAAELWVTFPILVERLRGLTDHELACVVSRNDAVA